MKTLTVEPVFVEYIPIPKLMEQGKIYISKKYGCANHLCLCECGQQTVTPLGDGEWTLTEENGKISLSPSINNYQLPCNSHYIITNNKVNFV